MNRIAPLLALSVLFVPPPKHDDPIIRAPGYTLRVVSVVPGTVHVPRQPVPDSVTCAMHFGSINAQVIGREVEIRGAAEVHDKMAGNLYVWLLRIHANNKKRTRLFERLYEDDVVWINQVTDISPEFHDTIRLRPGAYCIDLFLIGVPNDFNLNRLRGIDGDELQKIATHVSGEARIMVAD
jgi:hypothetical protein